MDNKLFRNKFKLEGFVSQIFLISFIICKEENLKPESIICLISLVIL